MLSRAWAASSSQKEPVSKGIRSKKEKIKISQMGCFSIVAEDFLRENFFTFISYREKWVG